MSVCRIAVCDDVEMEREILCMLLRKFDNKSIVYKFSCGEDLLRSSADFDLIFLDIYMNGMTGMETAKILHKKNSKVPIVFLTSSSDYAVESYEVHAFDYILKPMGVERFKEVWDRFLLQHRKNQRYFVVNCIGKTERLPYEQIEYMESDCHYVTFHMTDGSSIRINGRLDDIEQQLEDSRFLRCHKSFLINLNLTESMEKDFIMRSGSRVAYRKREKKQIQQVFYDYIRNEVRN